MFQSCFISTQESFGSYVTSLKPRSAEMECLLSRPYRTTWSQYHVPLWSVLVDAKDCHIKSRRLLCSLFFPITELGGWNVWYPGPPVTSVGYMAGLYVGITGQTSQRALTRRMVTFAPSRLFVPPIVDMHGAKRSPKHQGAMSYEATKAITSQQKRRKGRGLPASS